MKNKQRTKQTHTHSFFLIVFSLWACLLTPFAFGADWDSLGSSEAILKKAKALDPNNKVRVVQKRAVDRELRFEISGHYGLINGGDSYVKTFTGGGQLEFHINPRWSLGFRYDTYFNSLTSEGANSLTQGLQAIANGNPATIPLLDYPLNSQLATLSWYPIYGKLNLFDLAITQFDLYLMVGAGKVQLYSGDSAALFSMGGGAGLWFTQYLMARWELRYQGYKDKIYVNNPQINTMGMHLSVGLLL